jgi:flagellar protein FlaH
MPQKIAVITNDHQSIALAQSVLEHKGYNVLIVEDPTRGMSMVAAEKPHLIILDSMLPGVSEGDFIRHLRTDPATSYIPIALLITEEEFEELAIGDQTWVDGYLVKPLDEEELMLRLLSLLKSNERKKPIISSGNGELDSKMGGGIPVGSLTLIEGTSGAGKSVLSQQIIWGSLKDGFQLSLFTSENTVKSLVRQMQSLDLDILDFLLLGRLKVYSMELARLGREAPFRLLRAIKSESDRDLVIIDSLTGAIDLSSKDEIVSFFEESKRICAAGASVIIILHSNAVSPEVSMRIRSICDAHLQLRTEDDGKRVIKMLEVTKVRGGGNITGSIISFDVEPGWGMRVIPVNKVRG